MTKKIAIKEMVTVREMLLANSIQVMIDKGLITAEEFITKLKKVQAEYQRKIKSAG